VLQIAIQFGLICMWYGMWCFKYFGDVMLNHLLKISSLVAIEKPISTNAEDIYDEKMRKMLSFNL
jgi:hypothetical protein